MNAAVEVVSLATCRAEVGLHPGITQMLASLCGLMNSFQRYFEHAQFFGFS
jgi:hypothetical protein